MIFKKMGFTAQNKIKTTTLVFSVLCLILITNIQERMMIKRVNETVTSIYEDRVVVGNYILQLSNHMEEIVLLLKSNNTIPSQQINSILGKIDSINIEYDKTFLTENEKVNFQELTSDVKKIKQAVISSNSNDALTTSSHAVNTLKILSSIQVEEGKNKLDEVLSMTNTRSILSYLEIVIIIVISVLIQQIILSTRPIIANPSKEKHNLN